MSMPLEQLEAEALGLPIRERARLANRLLESLNEDATGDLAASLGLARPGLALFWPGAMEEATGKITI